jgi:amino acid transporter
MSENTGNNLSQHKFKRVLRTRDLVVMSVSLMTLTAPSLIFGDVTHITGGMTSSVMAVATVVMLLTALSYGKLASVYPNSGSTYTYVRRGIHHIPGFIAGWAILLSYIMIPSALVLLSAGLLREFVPGVPYPVWIVAIVFVVTALNGLGAKIASTAAAILLGLCLCIIAIYTLVCALAVSRSMGNESLISSVPFIGTTPLDDIDPKALSAAIGTACFALVGFGSASTLAEDSIDPKRDVRRALVIAVLGVGVIAVVQSYFAQLAWPDASVFERPNTALLEIARRTGGPIMANLYTVALIIAGVAATISGQSAASRVLFAMGRDKALPPFLFAHIHPKFGTPLRNILITFPLIVACSLLLGYNIGMALAGFGACIGFLLLNTAVIVRFFIRRRGGSVVTSLILPLFAIFAALFMLVNMRLSMLLAGVGWLLLGIGLLAWMTKGFKNKGYVS